MPIIMHKSPTGAGPIQPGPLMLPPWFDSKKYAAKWVKVGPAVQAAAEREWIPGTSLTADGWIVARDSSKKPCKVSLQSGIHVLLCRDAAVQKAVNAICGNVGKQRMLQERAGETLATLGGEVGEDPGMLSDERLSKVLGRERDAEDDGAVIMNPVPELDGSRVTPPAATTITSRRSRR